MRALQLYQTLSGIPTPIRLMRIPSDHTATMKPTLTATTMKDSSTPPVELASCRSWLYWYLKAHAIKPYDHRINWECVPPLLATCHLCQFLFSSPLLVDRVVRVEKDLLAQVRPDLRSNNTRSTDGSKLIRPLDIHREHHLGIQVFL